MDDNKVFKDISAVNADLNRKNIKAELIKELEEDNSQTQEKLIANISKTLNITIAQSTISKYIKSLGYTKKGNIYVLSKSANQKYIENALKNVLTYASPTFKIVDSILYIYIVKDLSSSLGELIHTYYSFYSKKIILGLTSGNNMVSIVNVKMNMYLN